jgi:hypothetical protein
MKSSSKGAPASMANLGELPWKQGKNILPAEHKFLDLFMMAERSKA